MLTRGKSVEVGKIVLPDGVEPLRQVLTLVFGEHLWPLVSPKTSSSRSAQQKRGNDDVGQVHRE